MLLGVLTGRWLLNNRSQKSKLLGMTLSGAVLMCIGVAFNPVIPINKKIWTDSFMLFSGGFSLVVLALLAWAIDMRGWRWGATAARIFGNNAILAFSLATMLYPLERMLQLDVNGKPQTIHSLIFQSLSRWISPYSASLGYALLFVVANAIVLWPLYRKRIFVRL
jgi:predicted acyltransferase